MEATLKPGQWVEHDKYPGAFGRIMPDNNPATASMAYHGFPFLGRDPSNNHLHVGQSEVGETTTEAHILWESWGGHNGRPPRSWEKLTHLKPADTSKYRIDVEATITVEMDSPALAKARDDVIQILTGAFEDAGMRIYIRKTHEMELKPA